MALPDSFLQDLRMKTDISDIVSAYVNLKRRGNTQVGLCPFHNEKTPSFTVYPETQSFYCFGCGAGGSAIEFIKKIENLDYIDAVKALAERAGMQMPDDGYDDTLGRRRKIMFEINRATARFYHEYMMSDAGKVGLNYWLGRGLSMKIIKHFGLGYAPDSWDALIKHLKSKGYSMGDIIASGVVRQGRSGYYDFFRGRVITPYIDVRGNVIAFGARVLDDSKPKYLNSAETLVFKKTYELFGLNYAKDSGSDSIILCEGYMDVIAMHQAGFTNAVAGCGTALTAEQVRVISRYAKEVILAYDTDDAGRKALAKAIALFNETDVKVRIPNLSGGKDPDEIIKKLGRAVFEDMLNQSSSELEYRILNLRANHNLATTQGKIDFLSDVLNILVSATPIEQDLYISRLSEELGVEKQSIKAQLDDKTRTYRRRKERQELNGIVEANMRETRKETLDSNSTTRKLKAQKRLIGLLLLYPAYIKHCDDSDTECFDEGFLRKVYGIIVDKIKNNNDLSLAVFGQYLTDDEVSKLSGMLVRSQTSANPEQEFIDCLNTIRQESKKTDMSGISNMSDDEFRRLFS